MNVYQIALPDTMNGSPVNYDAQRNQWMMAVLDHAGGLTVLGPRMGVWRDDADGTVYRELMHWYEIACDKGTMDLIVWNAMQMFPDQKALYVSKLGTAEIISRPPVSGGE
jgi:hypothetical protein